MKRTEGRWMWKRALSMLLVCVMLFSGVDLMALAAEPGVETEITTQEERTETTAPDDSEQRTGEDQNSDIEEVSDSPEAGDDTAADDIGESDQSGDVTEDEGDKEGSGGTGEADTDEGNRSGKEEQPGVESGEEESVSENSVSENNIVPIEKEQLSVQGKNMSVEASNGLGSLLLDELQIAAQEGQNAASQEYGILDIEVTGIKANVTFHAADDCTVIVSIYKEGSNKPEAFGIASVRTGESNVVIDIETESMPEFFVIKGYLVDSDSLRPLSKEYSSSMYTENMQAFLKKTTDDFKDSQVINLDESNTTNFVVVNDEVTLIREKKAESENNVNELISYNEAANTYVFSNVDENITSLQCNDIFVYQYNESEILAIKVSDILIESAEQKEEIQEENIQNDEDEEQTSDTEEADSVVNAIITATNDELCVDDVFQFVRIDENLGTAEAEEIDPAQCAEGVTYLGRGSAMGYGLEKGEVSVPIQPDAWSIDLKTLPKKKLGSIGPFDIEADGVINAEMGMEVKVKYYFDLHPFNKNRDSIWYVDIGISCAVKIEGTLKVEAHFSAPICSAVEIKGKLLTVKYVPEIVVGAEFDGSLKAEFTDTAGIKLGKGVEGVGPYFAAECTAIELSAELNGYIGIDFNPELKVPGVLEAELKMGVHAGAEVSVSIGASYDTQEGYVRHECGAECISGNFYINILLKGGLKILKLKEINLNEKQNFIKASEEEKEPEKPEESEEVKELFKITLGNFYWSIKHHQHGWGECPFKEYRTTVVVKTLSSQLVKGARVNNEATTDKCGAAKVWLPGGRQMIYATYNGKMGSKYINIDGVKSVNVILGMYADLGNDAVTQVCLGTFDRSAAVTRDGSLYTWGSNVLGSLGTGGTDDKSIPTKVLSNVKTVYSSTSHTRINAAITNNGDLYTWGQNSHGALGNGSTDNLYIPGKILGNVKTVSLGYYSGAAVTRDGQLYIWGKNPARILEDEIISDVCLGVDSNFGYSAALTKDGQLYMWGYNGNGELGNGKQSSNSQSEPVRILENEKVKKVCLSGGRGYSAAVTEGGQLYMWGYNGFGQLGNGTTATQTEPVKILEGIKVKEVAVGNTGDCYYSAAVTEDGQLYMWGRNTYGQLGKGDTDDRTVPVKIDGLGKVKHVCISSYHTAAITEDEQLYMWGRNNRGQLGDGSTEDKYAPVKILDNVMSVDVQDTYTAAVTVDGSLWMWGYNNNGQLGNGEEAFQAVTEPINVAFPMGIEKSVQSVSEAYTAASEDALLSDTAAYVLDEETLESKEAAYVYETLRTSSYPENSPVLVTVTDAENPLKQTADFSGLKSQETYNVYVMKDKDSKQRLSQDNLLYITQAVSGADGNLSITYEMREACEQPDVFCVGMTRTDLSAAEINVPDISYDGEEHVAETEVTLNGRTLIAGTDYEIYGDCVVSEIGEYKIVIKGIGTYCGKKEAVFRVVERTIPDDPDDPTPDPVYGDVLKEDIPADGIIPEGLWIAGVSEAGYDYTGKAIKPEARVYDHKTRLMEKTDYTIAYKNHIKAYSYSASDQAFAANKAPTITVTGKGNYTGKETQTFRILPLDIGSDVFAADNMTIAANKKNQKPVPALMWNDKKLKSNTDYTVTYYDSTGAKKLDYVKEAGNYYIEITGKGNFTGTRRVDLTVIGQSDQLKLMSKMTVAKIPNQPYTGSAIEPVLTVKDGKTTLNKNEHYTVSYSSNTEIGTAYAVVTGIEAKGYSGTKRVSFKITGGSVSKAAVTGLTGQTFIYGGVNKEPELVVAVKAAGVEKTLEKGADYKVTWQKNRDAGTATAIITGVGGYTGTLKKTFKIQAFDIAANADGRFTAVLTQGEVPYAKGGTKPEVAVTFLRDNGTVQKLREGKDYTLSYKNHTTLNDGSRADKLPTVTIKGKGNFKGTYGTKLTYKITTQSLGSLTLTAADKTYQNKKNIFAAKVTITDLNGKVLKAGTDYDKTFTYAYKNQTTLDNGTIRAAGAAVDKNDIIPAGTVLEVTVSAKGNYTGTKTGEYRIAQASISSASVSIPKQIYTGQAITPDKDQITVRIKGKPVDASQYEIVPGSYKNNIKKGTASVTIRGVDNYGGTKTVKFTIRAKGFLWWWRKG